MRRTLHRISGAADLETPLPLPPMKRHLLIIAICLPAGAVVNVAVAWSCAYWWDQIIAISSPMGHRSAQLSPTPWRVTVPAGWPQRPTSEVARVSAWYAFVDQVSVVEDQTTYSLSEFRFGFPAKSLSCYQLSSGRLAWWSHSWSFAMEAPGGTYPLPTRPLWLGFAANTLFYATLLWLLMYGLSALRRFLRVRRGLCPKCAYLMGESSVCTECGGELPRRARDSSAVARSV
jgi:hypothetical protein